MWRDLLRKAVKGSSRAAVARDLGVSRTSVSLLLAGKYPGDTRHMEQRIRNRLAATHNNTQHSTQQEDRT